MIAADGPNAPIQETVMLKATKHIDIEKLPELVRIAEEVRATQEPRLLRKGKEALALVVPVSARPDSPLPPTKASLAEGYGSVPAFSKSLSVGRMVEIATEEHAQETAREGL